MSIIGISDEVQEAVYERLTGDAALMALVGNRVHEQVPEGSAYPYVQIGETFETKDATFDKDGRSVLMWIHVWSQYRGNAQAWSIIGPIGDLLDEHALAVDGALTDSCEVEMTQVTRDPDGKTRHGLIHLRVRLSET